MGKILKMKKEILLLFVCLLVIENIRGQLYETKDTIYQLTVNDTRIYQILDSVSVKEQSQTYFTDTSLSIFMDITFCSDSNCVEFGKMFVVDIYFRETAAVHFKNLMGVFTYRGSNVFVEISQAPFVVFHYLFSDYKYPYPELQRMIDWQKKFPQQFTMFRKDDSKIQVFNFGWDIGLEIDVIYGGSYNFYRSRYLYDQDKFNFIDYKLLRKSTF